MKNIWTIMCMKSSVDANSNSLSLFDCIEEFVIEYTGDLNITEIKVFPISLEIVSLWYDEEINTIRNSNIIIELIDPQGKKINEFSQNLTIEKGKKRLRTITRINGLGITSEGTYNFRIKYKESQQKSHKKYSEIPFDVKMIKTTLQ